MAQASLSARDTSELEISARNPLLIKVAGVSALAVAVMQVVGNGLHPPVPTDTTEALQLIAGTGLWNVVHLIVTVSYFIFIPFVVGATESFKPGSALVRIATPLIIVGAALGAAQITTHLTIFKVLADQFAATTDAALRASAVFLYDVLWPYSVTLEIAHLLIIYAGALLFGIAMLDEAHYPSWIAWEGIVAAILAAVGILVGKLIVTTSLGDIIFGVSLIPLIIWIVATGVVLLRLPVTSS